MNWNNLKQPPTSKNDLKQPTMTYNEQEMTWNNPQWARTNLETTYNEQETTWNDPQRVRQNHQQPKPTYNEQKKNNTKQPTARRFSDYFTLWDNQFSSLTSFQPQIWLQLFEHCFTENHSVVYIMSS